MKGHTKHGDFVAAKDLLLPETIALLNHIPHGFVIVDSHFEILFANKFFYHLFHIKPFSKKGFNGKQVNWEDRLVEKGLAREISSALKTKPSWTGPVNFIGNRKKIIRAFGEITRVKLPHLDKKAYIIWLCELDKIQRYSCQGLVETTNFLTTLFDKSPYPICINDRAGKFLMVNEAACESSGYSKNELLSMSASDLDENVTKKSLAHLVQQFDTKKKVIFSGLHKRKDGSKKPVDIYLRKIIFSGEECVLAYWYDVSQREEYKKRLQSDIELRELLTKITNHFSVVSLKSFDKAVYSALGDLGRFAGVDRCYLFQFTPDGKSMSNTHEWCSKGTSSAIDTLQDLSLDVFSWITHKMLHNQLVAYSDINDLPKEASAEKKEFKREEIQSVLNVPLVCGRKIIGFVGFDAVKHPIHWTDEMVELLRDFSNFIGQALERKKGLLLSEQKEKFELSMTKKLLESREEQLHFFIKHVPTSIAIFDLDMRCVSISDRLLDDFHIKKKHIIGKTCYEVFNGDKKRWTNIYKRCLKGESCQSDQDLFVLASGKQEWVKWQVYPRRDEEDKIVGIIMLAELITDRIAYEDKIIHMTNYDYLTEIPNRKFFQEKLLERLSKKSSNRPYALLILALDNLHSVNNYFSIFIGDQMLREVSKRLTATLGKNAFVARLDGEQFAVILANGSKSKLKTLLDQAEKEISRPFEVDNYQIHSSVTIGVREIRKSDHACDILLRDAAIALQQARSNKNGRIVFFDEDLEKRYTRRLRLENGFQEAFDKDQFSVVYQPIYNIETHMISGIEALARWKHPTLKNVPPAEFIPIIEKTGNIITFGYWLNNQIFSDLQPIFRKLDPTVDFTVSINLSPLQMLDPNFIDILKSDLKKYHLPPERIQFEITETKLDLSVKGLLLTLHQIRKLGCKIAIDDFGTGHSALNRIQTLPVTMVKVDKSFVDTVHLNSRSASLVKHILLLANELNVKTLAEGIELKEQEKILHILGCEYGQGFLFSRPITLKKFIAKYFKFLQKPKSS